MIARAKNCEKNKLVALCLVIAPIFSNYVFISKMSFGDVFVLLTLPWLLIKFKSNLHNIIVIIFSAIIISYSFILLGGFDAYAGFYRAAFYYILIFFVVFLSDFEFPYFLRIYGRVSILASFAIIFQWIAYTWFGTTVVFQLPLEYYEQDTLNVIDHIFRAGGFFREPSYFSLYVMPYYIFAAIERKFKHLFIITIAGILSTSSLFFFLIAISFVVLIYYTYGFKIALMGFLLIIALLISMLLSYSDRFVFLERVESIFIDGGTLNDRFLPFMEVINFDQLLFPSVDAFNFYHGASLWFNSAASLVVYFGFLGLIFLLISIKKMGLLLGLLFVILIFSTHFMTGAFSYFIAICFMMLKFRAAYLFN